MLRTVERPEIKLALLSDALLAKTIESLSKLDLVITGIGVTISRSPLLYTPTSQIVMFWN